MYKCTSHITFSVGGFGLSWTSTPLMMVAAVATAVIYVAGSNIVHHSIVLCTLWCQMKNSSEDSE